MCVSKQNMWQVCFYICPRFSCTDLFLCTRVFFIHPYHISFWTERLSPRDECVRPAVHTHTHTAAFTRTHIISFWPLFTERKFMEHVRLQQLCFASLSCCSFKFLTASLSTDTVLLIHFDCYCCESTFSNLPSQAIFSISCWAITPKHDNVRLFVSQLVQGFIHPPLDWLLHIWKCCFVLVSWGWINSEMSTAYIHNDRSHFYHMILPHTWRRLVAAVKGKSEAFCLITVTFKISELCWTHTLWEGVQQERIALKVCMCVNWSNYI